MYALDFCNKPRSKINSDKVKNDMEYDEQPDENTDQKVLAKNDAENKVSRSMLFLKGPVLKNFFRIHRKITILRFCQ